MNAGTILPSAKSVLTFLLAVDLVASLLAAQAGGPSHIQFENRQKQSGVLFILDNGTLPDKPMIDGIPGGVALLDYDNDGYLDIFFHQRCAPPWPGKGWA